ncbi:hypothetical protein OOT08_01835, partial [Leucobacter sp. M11]|nr:hypothetical protein [Leucobacter sp. M11]
MSSLNFVVCGSTTLLQSVVPVHFGQCARTGRRSSRFSCGIDAEGGFSHLAIADGGFSRHDPPDPAGAGVLVRLVEDLAEGEDLGAATLEDLA